MNFLVLSLTCVFCKSAVCHRNLRMLAAAVSGTGLEAIWTDGAALCNFRSVYCHRHRAAYGFSCVWQGK